MTQPLIAVTMGDPAGIGPEIIARAFDEEDFREENRAIVIGDAAILERAARLQDLALRANVVAEPEDARFEPGSVDVISETELPGDLPFGELDARAGDAAFRYVERATGLAGEGRVGAIATAPLNKEAMHLAGHKYPGHTEILAELTGTKDYAMMLVTDELKVIHVSTHVSLREAIERARPERELAVIRLAHESLKKLGVESPKVAVAGLNPHAGENGRVRHRRRAVPRPGAHSDKVDGLRHRGKRDGRTAVLQDECGSRHGLRHCGDGEGRPGEPPRRPRPRPQAGRVRGAGGREELEVEFPKVVKVRQRFPRPRVESVEAELREQLGREEIASVIRPGMSVALTAGSRGIAEIDGILRCLVTILKEMEAEPFIVPSMGSHGGGQTVGPGEKPWHFDH